MQIKVTLIGPEANVPDSDRKNIVVETHQKRGDSFNVLKTDTVLESKETTFTIKPGDKLVIISQEASDEIVFDTQQNAGVRRSQQANDSGRADKPGEVPEHPAGAPMRPGLQPTNPNPPPSVVTPNGGRMSPQPRVNTVQPAQPKVNTTQPPTGGGTAPSNSPSNPPSTSPANPSGTLDSKDIKDEGKK